MKRSFVCVIVSLVMCAVPAAGWAAEFLQCFSDKLEKNLDDGSLLGAGAMIIESPYKGVDDDVYPVPVLIFETKRFFVDKTVAGYYFNGKTDPVRWAIIGSLRLQGFEAGDSADLAGMQDRDMAFDAGLRISWNNPAVDMAFEAVTDVSGVHEGQELRLGVSRELFEGFLTPKAGIKWHSKDLADYYYGVRPDEARAGRSEYAAGDDLEYMAGVTIGVPLGKKWALFGDIACSFLSDEAKDSPVVDDDAIMRYVAGCVYRF